MIIDSNRMSGGLLGLLVGDALGVPYEFHFPSDIPSFHEIEYEPPLGFQRAHYNVLPGTWSDDGSQTLILLESLMACNGLNLDHFANGLTRWYNDGFCAVDGAIFDVGNQTRIAIKSLSDGVDPTKSGPASDSENGNGSLMRVLPLALWHQGSDEELVFLAMQQSLLTHGHLRSQLACALYCLWAKAILLKTSEPWQDAEIKLRKIIQKTNLSRNELELILNPNNVNFVSGSGYVLDTLWSAKTVFESTQSYEECVRAAIAFGYDTDTTAAVAGGIAGIYYGLEGIPERWVTKLRGESIYGPILENMLLRSEYNQLCVD